MFHVKHLNISYIIGLTERKRCKDMIKTWKVWGAGLTTLYIIGKNIDEVLSQARLINPNYNTVQLYSKGGIDNDRKM